VSADHLIMAFPPAAASPPRKRPVSLQNIFGRRTNRKIRYLPTTTKCLPDNDLNAPTVKDTTTKVVAPSNTLMEKKKKFPEEISKLLQDTNDIIAKKWSVAQVPSPKGDFFANRKIPNQRGHRSDPRQLEI
jgi:hypothetical protein